ncbi:hypothetical protein VQ574_21695 (plasmid) [Stutzerimonas frequens]|uniref:hypothetical protein n=1 Tax=Stutzerimonas frequens TaxID=2968969 RepID=UPI002DBE8BBF|nr:hypothetical protein [Stutzerimonas frequens]WRW29342.1 hypothetical protein VQ574_21695 [Stutzerimonas frequens]
MRGKLTAQQARRFQKLCNDMAALIDELHEGDLPDAVFYLEDGNPALYDWPNDIDRRPRDALAMGRYWHKSGGGGQ